MSKITIRHPETGSLTQVEARDFKSEEIMKRMSPKEKATLHHLHMCGLGLEIWVNLYGQKRAGEVLLGRTQTV